MMSARIIPVVLLGLCVLAPCADADCTKLKNGVPSFSLKKLCGKTYYTMYMAHTPVDTTCIKTQVTCNDNEDIQMSSKVFRNGKLNASLTSVTKDLGNGVLYRKFNEEGVERKQYVLSYSEFQDGNFKFSFVHCDGNDPKPTNKGITGSDRNADFSDELRHMNKLYENGGLVSIPNTCD